MLDENGMPTGSLLSVVTVTVDEWNWKGTAKLLAWKGDCLIEDQNP